ncbi:glycosyltransferase family 2 protein [bacterium]|nr:glycosyltransferase family 2 protein [bacterium]
MVNVKSKITVVILNYNGLEDLEACLPSVVAAVDPEFDVLVVDNGSTDTSFEYVQMTFPEVNMLALGHNLGFAHGNNKGLRWAFGEGAAYAVLLNNDTRVEPDWLSGLREAFSSDPDVGIAGAKILNWEGNIVEFDGSVFNPVNASGGYLDVNVDDYKGDENIRDVGYACGGAMMISRRCFETIGGFDTSYYFYNEDVDLSLRAWIYGFRVVVNPQSVIYHRRGSSVRRTQHSGFRDYYGLRNALTTVLKNYEPATFKCIYRDLIRIYLLSGRWYLFKGVLMNIIFLPRTLVRRWKIQGHRVKSDHEIFVRAATGQPNVNREP